MLTSAGNLDLYKLYKLYFDYHPEVVFKNVTLSSDIEYKMVVLYDVVIKKFRGRLMTLS